MVGWILLLVVLALVLLACVLRLGVAAGYEEGGGWVKVHLGPKWVSLYPVPQARTARRRKKQRRKEAKAEATEDQKDREKFSLGGALDLALELLPQVKAAAGKFRRALRVDELCLRLTWGEPDPADAAIHYGRAWGIVEALLAFLEANFVLKHREVSLHLDYQIERPRLFVRASLSVTAAQLLGIVLPLGWAALKTLWKHRKQTAAAGAAAHGRKGEPSNGKESSCQ